MKNKKLFSSLPDELHSLLKKTAQPSLVEPMLATLTQSYFSHKDWLYEQKFDGIRCLAFKKNGVVTLFSRNNNVMNSLYPELVKALTKQSADNFIIDGEIVSNDQEGVSSFQLLQGRLNVSETSELFKSKKIAIAYCVFDIVYCNGYDTRELPLLARKNILKKLLHYTATVVYSEHIIEKGIPFFKKACKLHWEGVIAKHMDSPYVGFRSHDWLKFKCIMQQELVIGGYTEPQGLRPYFGALLVGHYKNGKLMYAGKVGTGYTEATLELLGKKLQKLETKHCPFTNFDISPRGIHWVKPMLVAEFQFAQWTKSGKLRVGRYKGLRTDKDAHDVVKETPKLIGP